MTPHWGSRDLGIQGSKNDHLGISRRDKSLPPGTITCSTKQLLLIRIKNIQKFIRFYDSHLGHALGRYFIGPTHSWFMKGRRAASCVVRHDFSTLSASIHTVKMSAEEGLWLTGTGMNKCRPQLTNYRV